MFEEGSVHPEAHIPHRRMLGVSASGPALKAWEEALGRKNYRLIIKEAA